MDEEHECEVTNDDLEDLRRELQDRIEDLDRRLDELSDEVRSIEPR